MIMIIIPSEMAPLKKSMYIENGILHASPTMVAWVRRTLRPLFAF